MAFTEFYCDPVNGSNLNSGHTTGSVYTSTGGNWTNSTRVFTVTDGTNPASFITAGQDFGSVYVTSGATQATFIALITSVQNATNGTVTFSSTFAGTNPSDGTGTMTLKVGGPWKGPSGSQSSPFTLSNWGFPRNTNGDICRVNLKNNASYLPTVSINSGQATVYQGYSSTVGDGGKALIDFGTSSGTWTTASINEYIDVKFTTQVTSGSSDLVSLSASTRMLRCVVYNARGSGIRLVNTNCLLREVEVYGNNRSNTASKAGIDATFGGFFNYCFIHDNTGSNTSGMIHGSSGTLSIANTVIANNGKYGIDFQNAAGDCQVTLDNDDFYNNGSDALHFVQVTSTLFKYLAIQNCNFIKNGGAAINNLESSSGAWVVGHAYNNGYGSGTQANGSANTLGHITEEGAVTYASNVTPWVDPANGDFRINLSAARGVGRAAFTQTDSSLSAPNTVGYPDIGAAQAQPGVGVGQKSLTFGG